MSFNAILVQLVGLMGTVLFFASYQCKTNKSLFRMQLVSYMCYTAHLLLLGAWTGGISYVLNTVRSFCLGSRRQFLKSHAMCAIICLLQVCTLIVTWSGPLCILPVVANIAATIGGYTHNPRTIRMTALCINSPMWIVYDIAVGSFAGVLDEAITSISVIISIIRYGWKNLDRIEA